MARKPRDNTPGGIYHVFARGNDRAPIFEDDIDRQRYLMLFGSTAASHSWTCLAYCLMPNHVHLLVKAPDGDLSEGMRQVQGGYAQWFNKRHERIGHLFQGRYGAVLIKSTRQLQVTAAYIARNPIKAGLCVKAGEWPWGSRFDDRRRLPRWLDNDRLLQYFADDPVQAARLLTRMVQTGEEPLEGVF